MTVRYELTNNIPTFFVEKYSPSVHSALIEEMGKQSKALTNYIISRHLTGGTTKDRLRVRTGHLRRTTRPMRTSLKGTVIEGGTVFGAEYAQTHVGERGKKTVIKGNPWLTVPLPPALTRAGVMKRPRAKDFPELFLITSKAGNLLLVQSKDGLLIPFFVLKRSVTVLARVHPEDILEANTKRITKGFSLAIEKASGKE